MLMKDIIIVCAGGYGREVWAIIKEINYLACQGGKEQPYHLIGFLSDEPDALKGSSIDVPIIGDIQNWKPYGDEVYALGLSNPKGKEKIAKILKGRGAKFESLIAPWSIVPRENMEIGEGCVITAYSIAPGAKIGNFVNIMGSMIGSKVEIGDYSTTTGFSNIASARIGKRVFVGSHAVIVGNRKVEDDAYVCVGSVVVSNIKAGTKVFGVPATKMDW